jgi:hypothetical protein
MTETNQPILTAAEEQAESDAKLRACGKTTTTS